MPQRKKRSPRKICTYCNKKKGIEEFHKDRKGKHAIRGDCKKCANKKRREYYSRTGK